MRNNSHFKTGTFKCSDCGKQTRHTGDNDGTDLCPLCNAQALCGNTVSDLTDRKDAWEIFKACSTVQEVYDLCDKVVGETQ